MQRTTRAAIHTQRRAVSGGGRDRQNYVIESEIVEIRSICLRKCLLPGQSTRLHKILTKNSAEMATNTLKEDLLIALWFGLPTGLLVAWMILDALA